MLKYICPPHHGTSKKGHDVIEHLEPRFSSDLLQEQKQGQTFIIKHPYYNPNGEALGVSNVLTRTAVKQRAVLLGERGRHVYAESRHRCAPSLGLEGQTSSAPLTETNGALLFVGVWHLLS